MEISYNNVSIDQNITLENKFESIDNNAYSVLDNLSSLRIVLKEDLLLSTIKIDRFNRFPKTSTKLNTVTSIYYGSGSIQIPTRLSR